jgi:hypothetical protein
MALFDRDQLPARSTLSRFLAALTPEPVEALRTLFLDDLESRSLSTGSTEQQTGGLVDRTGGEWVVFDIDGTREAARQRALPKGEDLPPAFRRLDEVCAPGYTGRKRGQVVRTRTVISQAHRFQWLGSFGKRGNGQYRVELRQGLAAITRSLTAHQLPQARALLRLDGQYGTGAVLCDLAGFAFVTRGKEYTALDHPLVQARLHLPPDQVQQRTAKPDGAQPLRLSAGAGGARGGTLPRGRRHASGCQKEEPRWHHACRHRLRTLLHQPATTGLHRLRCRRIVPASRCL